METGVDAGEDRVTVLPPEPVDDDSPEKILRGLIAELRESPRWSQAATYAVLCADIAEMRLDKVVGDA